MEAGGSSPAKTPISSLQEICQRIGKTPQYDLMAQEGRAHQPQFVFRCSVGDTVRHGQGGSKKSAKHASAEAVLSALRAEFGTSEDVDVDVPVPETVPVPEPHDKQPQAQISHDSDSSNPVGMLQELVVARGWRLPTYTLYAESGPAHKKEFIMCCAVETFKEFGNGTAKKHAKRNAALSMFSKIQSLPPDEEPHKDRENVPTLPSIGILPTYYCQSLFFTQKGKTVSFDVLYNSCGEKIGEIPDMNEFKSDPCEDLDRIAKKSNFSVEYHDIDIPTLNGEFQCLLLLTTQPSLCAHGKGAASDECRFSAATHAMRMLKVFTE